MLPFKEMAVIKVSLGNKDLVVFGGLGNADHLVIRHPGWTTKHETDNNSNWTGDPSARIGVLRPK
jgi:hypothetical protein